MAHVYYWKSRTLRIMAWALLFLPCIAVAVVWGGIWKNGKECVVEWAGAFSDVWDGSGK